MMKTPQIRSWRIVTTVLRCFVAASFTLGGMLFAYWSYIIFGDRTPYYDAVAGKPYFASHWEILHSVDLILLVAVVTISVVCFWSAARFLYRALTPTI